ncbi:hypothetical protein BS50DRAFT_673933 [Corynespora cassiicola Philippines]|uniref:Fungal STAND N-terminal Goodbye domain-containing protein n=1 Tax=Corynespora cassiicola Philippines TaxID=1448308 RepID=A0A2T2P110_CORCC|nr:hypothetical protein BS50DRAFT_673933 [Corynespora cassiicola Philippines]
MSGALVTTQDSIPRVLEQPLAVDFLQNRQEEFGALNLPYDASQGRFLVDERSFSAQIARVEKDSLSEEHMLSVRSTTESFHKAVEQLKKEGKDRKDIKEFDLNDVKDWNDVTQLVKTAETNYSNDEKKGGKIRKFFRKVGDNGKSIQSFVGLLPDGSYKTLCGGVTLILTAMIAHSGIREKMSKFMDELPEHINDCNDYSKLYAGGTELRRRVDELYISILKVLEQFVHWYIQSTFKRVMKSVLMNSEFGQLIDVQISNMQDSRKKFENVLEKYLRREVRMIHEEALEIHEDTVEIRKEASETKQSINRIEEKLQVLTRKSSLGAQILNNIMILLSDSVKNSDWKKDVRGYIEERNSSDHLSQKLLLASLRQARESAYDPKSLAKVLKIGISQEETSNDVDFVYAQGLASRARFQQRSRWIAQSSQLSDWIQSNQSSVLFIQGNHTEMDSASPASFVISLLYPDLASSDRVLALHFFCGLHTGSQFSDSAKENGPLIMAKTLLAQILSITTIDWDEGNSGLPMLSLRPQLVEKLKRNSFPAYLELICQLISALRRHHSAIFVMIDGIDYYDNTTWRKQVRRILRKLSGLALGPVKGDDVGAVKLLLTAGTHLSSQPKSEDGIVVLDVPDEIDGDLEGNVLDGVDLSD